MSKKITHYVYSTLSTSMEYTNYHQGGGDLPGIQGVVVIQGGANIPDKFMRTPYGVANPVTDEQLDILNANPVFQLHKANGYIVVKDKEIDADKVATEMETRDKSAPLVDADFVEPPVSQGGTDNEDAPKPKSSRKA